MTFTLLITGLSPKNCRLYKPNPRFFKNMLNHYKVKPENILHIGDSKSDIVTPKQLGVQTCWLNRRNSKWSIL